MSRFRFNALSACHKTPHHHSDAEFGGEDGVEGVTHVHPHEPFHFDLKTNPYMECHHH